jgi:ribosomal protein S18
MENNDNKLNKYKCVKVPFSSILHKTDYENLRILEDAITRTNTITTQVYCYDYGS